MNQQRLDSSKGGNPMPSEIINKPSSGEIFAVMQYADGRKEERHFKNLIVENCALLIAEFLKSNSASVAGIKYLAVGTGVGSGTQAEPEPATVKGTTLQTEVARKAVTVTYNTELSTIDDDTRYNVLDVVCTFAAGEATAALTEMGLFGGDASATAGTGTMINMRRFAVWNKPASASLTLTWRIKIQ